MPSVHDRRPTSTLRFLGIPLMEGVCPRGAAHKPDPGAGRSLRNRPQRPILGSPVSDREHLSLGLTRAVSDAYLGADWARLRTLYHDDALLCTMAAHQEILPPDALIRIFRELNEHSVYEVHQHGVVSIDDSAVLVSGQIRYPLPKGGFGHGDRTWVLTYKDGLLYRSCAYRNEAQARAAYAGEGIELGIRPKRGS